MKSLFFIFTFTLYFALLCTAQNNLPKELHLNHLFIEDELPEGHITKMFQDKEGYMWLGTYDGLIRYDGYTSKKYVLPSEKLRPASILDFCEDSTGKFWVADYYNGLYSYDRGNDSFIRYQHDSTNANSLAAGGLRSILADAKGNLWLTLFNNIKHEVMIDRFNIKLKRFKHFRFADKRNYIQTAFYLSPMYMDKSGNVWSGSANGLLKYDYQTDRFNSYFAANDSTLKKVNEIICADPFDKNVLWVNVINTVSGNHEGLWRCDINNKTTTAFRHQSNQATSLANDTVLNIQIDSKNRLWITTVKGLSLYNAFSKDFTNYCPDNDKTNPSVSHINHFEEDKTGNFWFAPISGLDPMTSAVAGIFAFNTTSKKFINYKVDSTQNDGLNDNYIFSLYMDHSGCLWLNSGSAGVQWINKERSKLTVHATALAKQSFNPKGFLVSCAEAPDHTIWLATGGGLYHWYPDVDSFALIHLGKVPDSSPVLAVVVDKQGLVWYCGYEGALQGLYCYNPLTKRTKNYIIAESNISGDYSILSMLDGHAGELWIGTNAGLFEFNKKTGTFSEYKPVTNSSLNATNSSADIIFKIFEDKEHILWLGTLNSIIQLNRETNVRTDYQNRLPHFQWVSNFYEDTEQHLWASSYRNGGLVVYDKRADTIKRLFEKDGLLFNGTGTILNDGKSNLWVKTVRGISIINPKTYAIHNLTDDVLKEGSFFLELFF